MTARHTVAAFGAAMMVSAGVSAAADGILIAQKVTSASGTVTTHQIEIEKTRMRAESEAAGRKMKMIFDGTAQVMRTVDDDAKSYTEMSKADMEKMSAQMSGAMAQMQEQMKNMPPEARKRMEAAMQGRGVPGGGAAAAQTEYKKIGTDKVGKWTCDKYEGTRGGEKVSELCTVPASALGFTAADFEVTKQMADFFKTMMPQAGGDQMFKIGTPAANGFSGLPVRTVIFRNGAPSITSEITDASRQNFPDAIFAVPAGYTKRDMMGGRGRGRQ